VTGNPIAIPVSPLSRGTVTITSNDTNYLPIIDPNWLTAETDIQVAIEAFKRARAMAEASSVRPIQLGDEVAPGSDVTTDEQIYEYIKDSAYMNWHASCTCRSLLNTNLSVTNTEGRQNGKTY